MVIKLLCDYWNICDLKKKYYRKVVDNDPILKVRKYNFMASTQLFFRQTIWILVPKLNLEKSYFDHTKWSRLWDFVLIIPLDNCIVLFVDKTKLDWSATWHMKKRANIQIVLKKCGLDAIKLNFLAITRITNQSIVCSNKYDDQRIKME